MELFLCLSSCLYMFFLYSSCIVFGWLYLVVFPVLYSLSGSIVLIDDVTVYV